MLDRTDPLRLGEMGEGIHYSFLFWADNRLVTAGALRLPPRGGTPATKKEGLGVLWPAYPKNQKGQQEKPNKN